MGEDKERKDQARESKSKVINYIWCSGLGLLQWLNHA